MERAELGGQVVVVLARILARARGDLGGEQIHDRAVLVGRPHGPVVTQEAGPGALLAAKTVRTIEQAGHETLEAHRHFGEAPPRRSTTRSMTLLLTSVSPTAAWAGHCGRWPSR